MERLDEAIRIVEDARRIIREIDELLERFADSLLQGSLEDAFGRLESSMRRLEALYPPARSYREKAELLRRYVSAVRVRVSLYGLRSYFREAEYIEKHFRDIMDFVESLLMMLRASRRASV